MTTMSDGEKITATEIELALCQFFDRGTNFVIPNIRWGFRSINYEIDLMIVTKALYAYEVEIKISPGDLKRDAKKHKWNYCGSEHYFKKSYFAIPEHMIGYQEFIPKNAGILAISYNKTRHWFFTKEIREPVIDKLARKITPEEYAQLGRLAMLRMWDLKTVLRNRREKTEKNSGGSE